MEKYLSFALSGADFWSHSCTASLTGIAFMLHFLVLHSCFTLALLPGFFGHDWTWLQKPMVLDMIWMADMKKEFMGAMFHTKIWTPNHHLEDTQSSRYSSMNIIFKQKLEMLYLHHSFFTYSSYQLGQEFLPPRISYRIIPTKITSNIPVTIQNPFQKLQSRYTYIPPTESGNGLQLSLFRV